uniref:Uncharacterized protein n=1 Tax=Palpitomonas bilix TaxID=652834 RepID=A0A7S3DB51_9EUKA|mmetsp:Transcript_29551/g.76287  ORF Transcript_29551/g.76287 Transcript_29551/m.76287 type:complete len:189 (+) Transcript_29551:50-616(+)
MEEVEAGYEEIEKQIEEEIRQRREKHNKPQRINASVLRRRCLPADAQGLEEDELVERLFNLTHVRLDRERIVTLDGIDMLGKVTNLYLQHNRISRIDNLDLLPSLRFLVLANNCIAKIENVSMLKNLQFFDVQHNEIENIEAGMGEKGGKECGVFVCVDGQHDAVQFGEGAVEKRGDKRTAASYLCCS